MRIAYNIGFDGWTKHPNGSIEISDHAWNILSRNEWVISCQIGFTDTAQLLAIARAIDAELEKETARHSIHEVG